MPVAHKNLILTLLRSPDISRTDRLIGTVYGYI
jgi:hypothetical protein